MSSNTKPAAPRILSESELDAVAGGAATNPKPSFPGPCFPRPPKPPLQTM